MRELQMAKAAIRAGLDILIKEAKITYKDVEHCYLAGGFGTKIDIRKAAGIGLIPEELANKNNSSWKHSACRNKRGTCRENYKRRNGQNTANDNCSKSCRR